MSNAIPSAARAAVRGRERQHCLRCGMRGAEIHHRRSKSVRDEHTHCPCNLVYLCGWGNHTGCHGWVHSNPFEARPLGLIVPRWCLLPGAIPVQAVPDGLVFLDCKGGRGSVEAFQPADGPLTAPVDLHPTGTQEGPQIV